MGRLTEENPIWINDETLEGACEPTCEEMDEVYRKLKVFEDIIDDPEKLKIIDALYLERCEEINRLRDELEEVKYENEETKKFNLELLEELKEVQDVN